MAGANSYRAVHSFIDIHLARLKQTFGLGWTRAPAYTTLRGILQGLDVAQVERVFRLHAEILSENAACPGLRLVGELGLAESVITVDAMHCQKKPSKSPPTRAVTSSPR